MQYLPYTSHILFCFIRTVFAPIGVWQSLRHPPPPPGERGRWRSSHLLLTVPSNKGKSFKCPRLERTKNKEIDETRERPPPVYTPLFLPVLLLPMLLLPVLLLTVLLLPVLLQPVLLLPVLLSPGFLLPRLLIPVLHLPVLLLPVLLLHVLHLHGLLH